MGFNPNEHLMSIKSGWGDNAKSSDYLPVQWRMVWFRGDFPEGSIETEVVMIDLDRVCEKEVSVWNAEKRRNEKVMKAGKGFACFKATIKTGKGGSATATGSESAVDFAEFIEKAETKAIGRALAALGFGTQFAPELNEGQRIVDAPVEQSEPTPLAPAPAPRQLVPAVKPAPTSSISAPTPSQLQKRCTTLLGANKFDAVKVKVLNANIPDGNLTPEQCSQIKRLLDATEKRRKQQAS